MAPPINKQKSISYRAKENTVCPICDHEFQQELLHSGGGRLIAGKLTQELRRLYEPNKKFGRVFPLAYSVVVCPQCLYSGFSKDYRLIDPSEVENIQKRTVQRRTGIEKIVGPVDFHEDRNLVHGAASYVLAIDCYQLRGQNVAPTPKKAICSIRSAWLFGDLAEDFPTLGFDKVRDFMYTKAVEYYDPTLDIMSTGREPHEQFTMLLGPDTDNNWGFDGVIYLNGYLTLKYLKMLADTKEAQLELLDRNKRFLGKLYGMGRASKSKPSVIIDMSKELYESIQKLMEEMTGTVPAG